MSNKLKMPKRKLSEEKEASVVTASSSGVVDPHDNDVLSGRGDSINKHPGNKYFRTLVEKKKKIYATSLFKREKRMISASIVSEIQDLDPPGRFLSKNSESGLWQEIGDEKAREKTSQALREKTRPLREVGMGAFKVGRKQHGTSESIPAWNYPSYYTYGPPMYQPFYPNYPFPFYQGTQQYLYPYIPPQPAPVLTRQPLPPPEALRTVSSNPAVSCISNSNHEASSRRVAAQRPESHALDVYKSSYPIFPSAEVESLEISLPKSSPKAKASQLDDICTKFDPIAQRHLTSIHPSHFVEKKSYANLSSPEADKASQAPLKVPRTSAEPGVSSVSDRYDYSAEWPDIPGYSHREPKENQEPCYFFTSPSPNHNANDKFYVEPHPNPSPTTFQQQADTNSNQHIAFKLYPKPKQDGQSNATFHKTSRSADLAHAGFLDTNGSMSTPSVESPAILESLRHSSPLDTSVDTGEQKNVLRGVQYSPPQITGPTVGIVPTDLTQQPSTEFLPTDLTQQPNPGTVQTQINKFFDSFDSLTSIGVQNAAIISTPINSDPHTYGHS